MRQMLLITCLSLPFLAPSLLSQDVASRINIAGVALGSSYTQSTSKLTSQGFRQVKNISFPSDDFHGAVFIKNFQSPAQGNPYSDQYAIESFHGNVVAVDHLVTFPPDALPNLDQTVQEMRQKYGSSVSADQPTANIERDRTLLWYLDASGKARPLNGPGSISCTGVGGYHYSNEVVVADPMSSYRTECDVWIGATVVPDPKNPHLLKLLRVGIVDDKTMRAFATQRIQQQQGKTNQQTDGSKKVHAPI